MSDAGLLERIPFKVQSAWFGFVFVVAFIGFIGVFIYAFNVTAVDPEDTLIVAADGTAYAPFADPLDHTDTPGHNTTPLDKANRSYKDLENWISILVSEALSFDAVDYYATLAWMRVNYFSKDAYEAYQKTLDTYGIAQYLSTTGMSTSVLIEETPVLLNDGPVAGRYRWLYEVPVTITYRQVRNPQAAPKIVRARIKVQVGRVMDETDPMAMRVDTWEFIPRRGQR